MSGRFEGGWRLAGGFLERMPPQGNDNGGIIARISAWKNDDMRDAEETAGRRAT